MAVPDGLVAPVTLPVPVTDNVAVEEVVTVAVGDPVIVIVAAAVLVVVDVPVAL